MNVFRTRYPGATSSIRSRCGYGDCNIRWGLDRPAEGTNMSFRSRKIPFIDVPWKLYELFAAYPSGAGYSAGSGAIFDLSSNALRPAGWTSADAAGLPIFPGLVRYDEVVVGKVIRHAQRFTVRERFRSRPDGPADHAVGDAAPGQSRAGFSGIKPLRKSSRRPNYPLKFPADESEKALRGYFICVAMGCARFVSNSFTQASGSAERLTSDESMKGKTHV